MTSEKEGVGGDAGALASAQLNLSLLLFIITVANLVLVSCMHLASAGWERPTISLTTLVQAVPRLL